MTLSNRRVLYISYNGMLDPLGQSQVIPYLKELSRAGVEFTLLSFERPHAFTRDGAETSAALQRDLAASGIDWHWLRYHKTPSLPATLFAVPFLRFLLSGDTTLSCRRTPELGFVLLAGGWCVVGTAPFQDEPTSVTIPWPAAASSGC